MLARPLVRSGNLAALTIFSMEAGLIFLIVAGFLTGRPGRADEPGLAVAEFDKLHKELTTAREPWQTMPWQLSLLEARALAARENNAATPEA